MKNLFEKAEVESAIERINKLSPESKALWGKMDAAQMFAHCNVTYEYVFEDKYTKPKGIKKF